MQIPDKFEQYVPSRIACCILAISSWSTMNLINYMGWKLRDDVGIAWVVVNIVIQLLCFQPVRSLVSGKWFRV